MFLLTSSFWTEFTSQFHLSPYELWQLNNETGVENVIYYKQGFNGIISPLTYSSLLSIQRCKRGFHCSKKCCSSFLITIFNNSAVFALTFSTDWKCFAFNSYFGKQLKVVWSEIRRARKFSSHRIDVAFCYKSHLFFLTISISSIRIICSISY